MDFLQGLSECWWPGPTCRVDWEAVAAIATALGVLVALFGPPTLHWLRLESGTRVLASAWIDRVRFLRAQLEVLSDEFPMGNDNEGSWGVEGNLLAGITSDDLVGWHDRLRVDREAYAELATWTTARSQIVFAVSEALREADRVAIACSAASGAITLSENEWKAYVAKFASDLASAKRACDRAIELCERYL